MIRETVGHLRDLPRYRQILATLVRYGYQDVVSALHLEGIVRPIERVALGDDVPPQDRARRLRMVCEDLGPTFVKLGQVLSTRPDLLPEAYTTELAALRDDVRPFSYDEAEAILAEEYGRPLTEVFAEIDPVPVASASISQVHRATLRDGRMIALKIRRPGIDKTVQADLDILKNLAQLAERRIPALVPYGPVALAREFERSLKRELDFTVERRTMERCRGQFAREPTAHIPYVVKEYSTPRVIAMEFIGGVGVTDLDGLRRMGVAPAEVAVRGARILLRQIFRFGFFHADPHPGNLRVLPGGVIAPLDYGMFGQLDARTRERIADLLMGLLGQETDRVLRALDALEIRGEHVDPRALRRDAAELVASYADLSLDTIDLGVLLHELIAVIRTHRLHIPPDLVLLIRALVTIDGVGRTLDPHFDIAAGASPVHPRADAPSVPPLAAPDPDGPHRRGHPTRRHPAPRRDAHLARIDQARRADRPVRPAALREPGPPAHPRQQYAGTRRLDIGPRDRLGAGAPGRPDGAGVRRVRGRVRAAALAVLEHVEGLIGPGTRGWPSLSSSRERLLTGLLSP